MSEKKKTYRDYKKEFGINKKEYEFLIEYTSNGYNGTRASRKTYNFESDKSHGTNASNILKKEGVKAVLDILMSEKASKLEIKQEQVLRELAIIGFSDIKNYFHFAGDKIELKSSDQLDECTKAIKKIIITPQIIRKYDEEKGEVVNIEGSKVQLELHNKEKAIEMLANATGIFNKDSDEERKLDINIKLYEPKQKDDNKKQ